MIKTVPESWLRRVGFLDSATAESYRVPSGSSESKTSNTCVTCFSEICSVQDMHGSCPNRTHTALWRWVFRTVIDAAQPHPGTPNTQRQKERQKRGQRRRSHRPSRQGGCRWTQLRRAPAGPSEFADTATDSISPAQMRQSRHPHSASRWRAQHSRAPFGATDLADTDSATICHGWTGRIFINPKWPVIYNSGTSR